MATHEPGDYIRAFGWSGIADVSWKFSKLPLRQTQPMVHQTFPAVVLLTQAEYLSRKVVIRRDASLMHPHDIKPEVHALTSINLIRYSVVQDWRVITGIFKFALG